MEHDQSQASSDPAAQAKSLIEGGKKKVAVKSDEFQRAGEFSGLSELGKVEVYAQRNQARLVKENNALKKKNDAVVADLRVADRRHADAEGRHGALVERYNAVVGLVGPALVFTTIGATFLSVASLIPDSPGSPDTPASFWKRLLIGAGIMAPVFPVAVAIVLYHRGYKKIPDKPDPPPTSDSGGEIAAEDGR